MVQTRGAEEEGKARCGGGGCSPESGEEGEKRIGNEVTNSIGPHFSPCTFLPPPSEVPQPSKYVDQEPCVVQFKTTILFVLTSSLKRVHHKYSHGRFGAKKFE